MPNAAEMVAVRHFGHLNSQDITSLFEHPPEPFGRDTPDRLAMGLGATLYIPADRPSLVKDVSTQAAAGVTSAVLCLEDAVADDAVPWAESNLVAALRSISDNPDGGTIPLLFVRVREAAQILRLVDSLGPAAAVLSGVVLPKFTAATAPAYMDAVDEADRAGGTSLLTMPVLESGAVLYAETRLEELARLRALFSRYRSRTLAIRIGATDLCALYGLRRPPELSIYDVGVVASLITDIVNVLGRADGTGFPLAGPVWEYFPGPERLFAPQLRRSPFDEHDMAGLRAALVSRSMDGLIREVALDKANGLVGKTTIHPSHVPVVNALHVVSSEEYRDARDVLENSRAGGVRSSTRGNKMNEARPHAAWARTTMLRAAVFGVAAEDVTFVDLLNASMSR